MAATVTSNGIKRASQPPPAPLSAESTAHRDRSRVAAGALILAACTFGAVVLYGRIGDRQAVLAMARTVEVGKPVESRDLRVVHVSSDPGLRSVPAAERTRVIGRPAAVRLVSGSLLSPDEVGGGAGLPEGMALVGAVLKAGQFPLGLAPGDRVALVAAPASASGLVVTFESQGEPPTATVVAVDSAIDATGNTAVSLQVPMKAAAAVAGAGSAGRLNLVVVGR